MAVFSLEMPRLLAHEGGYVNNPDDPGGATNLGITIKTLRSWRASDAVTKEDVKALTVKEATSIYFIRYWMPLGLDSMTHQSLAGALFDASVNSGPSQAVTTLQRAVNSLGGTLAVDGKAGPNTMGAVNSMSEPLLMAWFALERIRFYSKLGHENESQWQFMYGWVRRSIDRAS